MERRINTQGWDEFDYLAAIRRREKWIWHVIALKAGLAAGSGIVRSGVGLQEKVEKSIRD
jgi:hypothetical protein